jgi:hypothetical protein
MDWIVLGQVQGDHRGICVYLPWMPKTIDASTAKGDSGGQKGG